MLFRAVRVLSTALLMSSSMMVCLGCRAMGQTPIFDQLWGELINADVSSSDVAGCRFDDSGRHCLHEEESGAAAVGMRRGRPGTASRTGWRGRVGHARRLAGRVTSGGRGAWMHSPPLLQRRLVCQQSHDMPAMLARMIRSRRIRRGKQVAAQRSATVAVEGLEVI